MQMRTCRSFQKIVLYFTLGMCVPHPCSLSQPAGTWRYRLIGNAFTVGINPLNANTVYAEGGGGVLLASYNRGSTWTTLGSTGISQIRQILVHPSDTATIFCVAFTGGLRRTTNYGSTWSTVLSVGIDGESIAYDPVSPNTMYAGNYSNGNVYRSSDRGQTWTLMGPAGDELCALVVRHDSTNILFAGTGNGRISKSTDSGVTWRVVKPEGSAEIPKIVINPANPMIAYAAGYAGPDSTVGVWKTTNGGEAWVFTGLQQVSIWALEIVESSPNILYAGTFSETATTVYRTTDAGATWAALTSGLPTNANSWSLKIHPQSPNQVWLAVTGNGQGIYRWSTTRGQVQGAVVDEITQDTIRNGFIRIPSTRDSVNLGATSGRFTFHYFEGDTTLTPTAHAEAYPYFMRDLQLRFVLDSVVRQNISLQKLTLSFITGTVRDSVTLQPLRARVSVSAVTSIGNLAFSDSTDASGFFQILGLYISHPPVNRYDRLLVEPNFPYAQARITPITLGTSGLTLQARLAVADVLLTAPTGSGGFENYYLDALDSLHLTAYYWDSGSRGLAPLSRGQETRKRSVIYFTGNRNTPLSVPELDSLNVCFHSGTNLFLTGQDFVQANDSTNFVANTIGVRFGGTAAAIFVRGVTGDLFDGITLTTVGTGGANNQTSRDILSVINPRARVILQYSLGTPADAAVRIDSTTGGGKCILFGFGFEAISAASFRKTVLQRIIGYFDGSIVGVEELPGSSLPLEYVLDQNYPNPFNPSTTIRYGLPVGGRVTIAVYDMLGRKVSTLLDQNIPEGYHDVTWDARDRASGVYFCRMTAGISTRSVRMLLIR
jgi:photosystem II stability/assembly factor-like uncharacterized protein